MSQLTPFDISELTAFRCELHRFPELSGEEQDTARRVKFMLSAHDPDRMITGIGGHGLAAIYEGSADGPTVMIRCELDALPIQERSGASHASTSHGKAHLCGHDGHMAIVAGLARLLHRQPPLHGRVVLLFQPAEETGAGAGAVTEDPKFAEIRPDYAFALHNRPGFALGHVGLAEGPVNCASRGMKLRLRGKEAHASEPQNGVSPAPVLAELAHAFPALSRGKIGEPDFTLVTLTHLRMGAPAFGISPGEAEIFATLRTATDAGMNALLAQAETLVRKTTEQYGVCADWDYVDVFHHCENNPEAVSILRSALDGLGISHDTAGCPMSASEDFGRFGQYAKSAMLFLGAGETCPALHNPDYDFPDQLIPRGIAIFERVLRDMLG
ncbi:amidohydrolase [Primorskyibacter aestuariivivens]|uniref:amidohydrolase n=1 Tax=Primorskyibacter aestuariivivens TaxID=1888912 RepID=UPI0023008275|nr:amidohydrolase [Primorskyibacter aestuariivivens]MDA7427650.1 amidohydrolase [Primorskyibacter aestuariivivens]